MKPLRFLMLNWRDPENPLAGGAERVTQRHMAELVRRGHEVIWFANDFEDAEPETVIDCIRIIRGGWRGSSILHARRCHREHRPFDLVIDQHHGLPWFAHWWSGTKCVAYIHEVLGPIWRAFYRWPTSTIGRVQERFFQRLYAGVPFWTVSESTRQQLLSHGVRDVSVWPTGTDTATIRIDGAVGHAVDVHAVRVPLRAEPRVREQPGGDLSDDQGDGSFEDDF